MVAEVGRVPELICRGIKKDKVHIYHICCITVIYMRHKYGICQQLDRFGW